MYDEVNSAFVVFVTVCVCSVRGGSRATCLLQIPFTRSSSKSLYIMLDVCNCLKFPIHAIFFLICLFLLSAAEYLQLHGFFFVRRAIF